MKAKEITRIALFSAITAILAQLRVDIGPVPITFQVMAVMLAGLLLTPREALLSQLVYVIMGLIGLPVYAGFRSGASILFGPTGGYLMAFPVAAFLIAILQKRSQYSTLLSFLSTLLGLIPIYLSGWLLLSRYVGGLERAFQLGVLPFFWIDMIKALLAVFVSKAIERYKPALLYEIRKN
ncbi:MAG: biotin transport system substrate-specific component [Thermotogota bacterium]|nr:biotin transport system substrate-specific component [Thermotogota bacterium]MDK2864478.1 biotin transport system substrate-specific component [Thermotogota bacterium]HCZ06499.1 biotin transporter BioY [Thermotogota bacterium]